MAPGEHNSLLWLPEVKSYPAPSHVTDLLQYLRKSNRSSEEEQVKANRERTSMFAAAVGGHRAWYLLVKYGHRASCFEWPNKKVMTKAVVIK